MKKVRRWKLYAIKAEPPGGLALLFLLGSGRRHVALNEDEVRYLLKSDAFKALVAEAEKRAAP